MSGGLPHRLHKALDATAFPEPRSHGYYEPLPSDGHHRRFASDIALHGVLATAFHLSEKIRTIHRALSQKQFLSGLLGIAFRPCRHMHIRFLLRSIIRFPLSEPCGNRFTQHSTEPARRLNADLLGRWAVRRPKPEALGGQPLNRYRHQADPAKAQLSIASTSCRGVFFNTIIISWPNHSSMKAIFKKKELYFFPTAWIKEVLKPVFIT